MGLIGGIARTAVIAGTATAVGNRVSRRQGNRWAQQDQAQYEQQQQQYAQPVYAAPPPAPARHPRPTTWGPNSRGWPSSTPVACSPTRSSPRARPRSSASEATTRRPRAAVRAGTSSIGQR